MVLKVSRPENLTLNFPVAGEHLKPVVENLVSLQIVTTAQQQPFTDLNILTAYMCLFCFREATRKKAP